MRNREIIIAGENLLPNQETREAHFRYLSKILLYVESMDAFCTANEIIDINHLRLIRKKHLIQKTVADNCKPFVFLINKN